MAKDEELTYCKICDRPVEDFKKHLAEEHDLTLKEYKRLVQCKVCQQWLKQVNVQHLSTHDMTLDEYERYDPSPAFPPDPIVEFYRVVEESEPTPPEPIVKVRLVNCESNPFTCFVEARRGAVYYFIKPTKGKTQWQSIPALDAHILLGSEGIPPKYPHLKFEKKRR